MPGALKLLVAADVDPTTVIGGAERALAGQLDELVARGYQITVMTRRQEGLPADESIRPGYRIVRYPMPSGMSPMDLMRALLTIRATARQLIASDKPDLIYIQQPLAGAGTLLAGRARALPGAYQFHSPWSDEFRLRLPRASANVSDPESVTLTAGEKVKLRIRRNIEDMCVRHVNRVLVLSKFMRDRCRRLHAVPESRFSIVPGGVDTAHFHDRYDRATIRARLQIRENERLLLTVRNLEPRMGVANLIEAMPTILKAAPQTVCIIGGSGPLLTELKEQAASIGVGNRIRFAGFIPEAELPEYYAAADLFVLPTTALEGFGMVTVEALACGTPTAGTPVGATPEILDALDPELLISGVGPSPIVERCLALLGRSDTQQIELRGRCRRYAENNYSWSAVVNGIEKALHECVSS